MGEKVINKWSPDTCGCVINYSWDRDSSENGRVHTFEGSDRKCQDHGNFMEQDLYNVVVEENQRKNIVLQHALDNIPRFTQQKIDRKGQTTNIKRDDLEYSFFFDGVAPNRILNVMFAPDHLTGPEKALVESRFPGKIKVQG